MPSAENREIKHILYQLSCLQGITRYFVLTPEDCAYVREHEDATNLGVLEAVGRKYCVCVIHDSTWREPTQKIVHQGNGEIIFPPVVFPEVPAKNVVSSSPGLGVHDYLCQHIKVIGDEATLLIGFDI
ncbi:MAG: hypothetical protein Q8P05_02025 [Candidatus Diapherotrites archaeon]|nr:hypothetical protein [Candidatus Diapherotrites archaeon]